MRISDWSSDVCSSDLAQPGKLRRSARECQQRGHARQLQRLAEAAADAADQVDLVRTQPRQPDLPVRFGIQRRSEEHTSELQSLMRRTYAVFCLKTNT